MLQKKQHKKEKAASKCKSARGGNTETDCHARGPVDDARSRNAPGDRSETAKKKRRNMQTTFKSTNG